MHLWWKILPRPFHRHWIDLSPIACIALQADRPRGCMNVSFSFPILLCRMSFPFCFVRLAFSPWLFPPLHSPLFFSPVPCLSSSMGLSLVRPWCWLENKQQQQTGTPVLPRHCTLVFTSFHLTKVFPGVFQDGPAPLDGTHPPSHPRTWQGHWVARRTCVDEDPRRSVRRIPSQPANPRSDHPRRGPRAAPPGTRKTVRSVEPNDPARGLVRSPRKERYLAVSTVRSPPGSCLLPRGRSRSSSEISRRDIDIPWDFGGLGGSLRCGS